MLITHTSKNHDGAMHLIPNISENDYACFEVEGLVRKLVLYLQNAANLQNLTVHITFCLFQNHLPPPPPPPPPPPGPPPPISYMPPIPVRVPQPRVLVTKGRDREANILAMARALLEPFGKLRAVPKASLESIEECTKIDSTDCLWGTSGLLQDHGEECFYPVRLDGGHHPNNSFIYHIPREDPGEAVFDENNKEFQKLKSEWELMIRGTEPKPSLSLVEHAFDAFAVFIAECRKVMRSAPQRNMLVEALHEARVARADGDMAIFLQIQTEVIEAWEDHLEADRARFVKGHKALREIRAIEEKQ